MGTARQAAPALPLTHVLIMAVGLDGQPVDPAGREVTWPRVYWVKAHTSLRHDLQLALKSLELAPPLCGPGDCLQLKPHMCWFINWPLTQRAKERPRKRQMAL